MVRRADLVDKPVMNKLLKAVGVTAALLVLSVGATAAVGYGRLEKFGDTALRSGQSLMAVLTFTPNKPDALPGASI